MGEAKRRGTREQREAMAPLRRQIQYFRARKKRARKAYEQEIARLEHLEEVRKGWSADMLIEHASKIAADQARLKNARILLARLEAIPEPRLIEPTTPEGER